MQAPTLSSRDLFIAKRNAHAAIDVLWTTPQQRTELYQWLGYHFSDLKTMLDGTLGRCHISRMTLAGCERVIEIIETAEIPEKYQHLRRPEALRHIIHDWNVKERPAFLGRITLAEWVSPLYDKYFVSDLVCDEDSASTATNTIGAGVRIPDDSLHNITQQLQDYKRKITQQTALTDDDQMLAHDVEDTLIEKSASVPEYIFKLTTIEKIDRVLQSEFLLHHLGFLHLRPQQHRAHDTPPKRMAPKPDPIQPSHKKPTPKGRRKRRRHKPTHQRQAEAERSQKKAVRKAITAFQKAVQAALLEAELSKYKSEPQPTATTPMPPISTPSESTAEPTMTEQRNRWFTQYGAKSTAELQAALKTATQPEETSVINSLIRQRQRASNQAQNKADKQQQLRKRQERQREIRRCVVLLNTITGIIYPDMHGRWSKLPSKDRIDSPLFSSKASFELISAGLNVLANYLFLLMGTIVTKCGIGTIKIDLTTQQQKRARISIFYHPDLLAALQGFLRKLLTDIKRNPMLIRHTRTVKIKYLPPKSQSAGILYETGFIFNQTATQLQQFVCTHRRRLSRTVALLYDTKNNKILPYGKIGAENVANAEVICQTIVQNRPDIAKACEHNTSGAFLFVLNYDILIGEPKSQEELSESFNSYAKVLSIKKHLPTYSSTAQALPSITSKTTLAIGALINKFSMIQCQIEQNGVNKDSDGNITLFLEIGKLGSCQGFFNAANCVHDDGKSGNPGFIKRHFKVSEADEEDAILLFRIYCITQALTICYSPYQQLNSDGISLSRRENDKDRDFVLAKCKNFLRYLTFTKSAELNESLADFILRLSDQTDSNSFGIPKLPAKKLAAMMLAIGEAVRQEYAATNPILEMHYFMLARRCLAGEVILPKSTLNNILTLTDQRIVECIHHAKKIPIYCKDNYTLLKVMLLVLDEKSGKALLTIPEIAAIVPFNQDELAEFAAENASLIADSRQMFLHPHQQLNLFQSILAPCETIDQTPAVDPVDDTADKPAPPSTTVSILQLLPPDQDEAADPSTTNASASTHQAEASTSPTPQPFDNSEQDSNPSASLALS